MPIHNKVIPVVNQNGFKKQYPFASHYTKINGMNYHFVDEGNGDPVIMVHGNPTWSFYFRKLIAGLRTEYRTIAPDHMGCGLSEKPTPEEYDFKLKNRIDDFETFIQRLNLNRKITLVVHDWGGMIGMTYALRHTETIGRIVILNTSGFLPPNGKPIPLRLKLIRNFPWFAEYAVLGLNLFARAAITMAPYKKLSADVKKGLLAPYNNPRSRMATLKFVQDIPLTASDKSYDIVKETDSRLNELSHIPMLILWGEHDFVFDMDYFNEWQKRFPQASTKSFPDAGHYILEDKPDAVLDEVKLFLTKHQI